MSIERFSNSLNVVKNKKKKGKENKKKIEKIMEVTRNEELAEEFRVTVFRDTPIGKYYAEFATYD